jgi:hypothetical protein
MLSKSGETVSVGELAMLKGHIYKEGPGELWNWNCSCGQPVSACGFWSVVLKNIKDENFETKINWPFKSVKILLSSFISSIAAKSLLKYIHTKKNIETTATLNKLYKAISKVSNKEFIVDSSKDPMQALAVNECNNVNAKFIWLTRDLRAITYSKLKRWKVNKRSDKGAYETMLDSFFYKKLCAAGLKCINKKNTLKISYEQLAANTQKELDIVCVKFGLKQFVAPEFMELSNDHTIAGTPGRFDRRVIAADTSWKDFYKDKRILNTLGNFFNSI